jgi:hypothetical protein
LRLREQITHHVPKHRDVSFDDTFGCLTTPLELDFIASTMKPSTRLRSVSNRTRAAFWSSNRRRNSTVRNDALSRDQRRRSDDGQYCDERWSVYGERE